MSDAELEAFEEAIDDLGSRVSDVLADGSDRSVAEIDSVEDLPMPDPRDDRAVEE